MAQVGKYTQDRLHDRRRDGLLWMLCKAKPERSFKLFEIWGCGVVRGLPSLPAYGNRRLSLKL